MDFDQAVATHTQWKRRLREHLAVPDCNLIPAEIQVDDRCVLGQWIHAEGASYSSLPEYRKLKFEHARFHEAAAEIVRKTLAGELVAEELEPCSRSDFSSSSAAVVLALMAIKKALAD